MHLAAKHVLHEVKEAVADLRHMEMMESEEDEAD
jgi:hypothetical protein